MFDSLPPNRGASTKWTETTHFASNRYLDTRPIGRTEQMQRRWHFAQPQATADEIRQGTKGEEMTTMVEKPSAVGEAPHLELQSTSKQSQLDSAESAKRATHRTLCCWISYLDWGEDVGGCLAVAGTGRLWLAAPERGGRRRSSAQVGPGPLLGPIFLKPSPGSLAQPWSSSFLKVG